MLRRIKEWFSTRQIPKPVAVIQVASGDVMLKVASGDVMLFRVGEVISGETTERLRRALREYFPDQKILVLDPSVKFDSIVKRADPMVQLDFEERAVLAVENARHRGRL